MMLSSGTKKLSTAYYFLQSICKTATALSICLAILAVPSLAMSAEIFGTIELVEGAVRVFDDQGQSRLPQVDDKLSEGDTVVTGRDGELHVRTEDHGFVALRPGTRFRIDAYSAHATATDKSAFSLFEGALRSITGWIGKVNPKAYSIKTPVATIGVRGTDHETTVILPPEPGQVSLGAPGTYDKVNQGSTVMSTDKGTTVVQPNQAAFVEHEGKTAPRVLESVPAFYKPTQHEKRIEERRDASSAIDGASEQVEAMRGRFRMPRWTLAHGGDIQRSARMHGAVCAGMELSRFDLRHSEAVSPLDRQEGINLAVVSVPRPGWQVR